MTSENYANYGTVRLQAEKFPPSYTRRTCCRLCTGTSLTEVLSLTPTPPANAFVSPELVEETDAVYPLTVVFCEKCYHVQLVDVLSAEALFKHYVYVSGTSPVMVEHLRQYADEAVSISEAPSGSFVLEFGSNDGTLLNFFKKQGFEVLGVDPAENLVKVALEAGIHTECAYFSAQVADNIVERYGKAKIICANHVCAHVDDFIGLLKGVKTLLAEDGIWIFEVGYLLSVYTKNLFDTIYHEHLDFHTVLPIMKVLRDHGLRLSGAKQVNIQGGSLRCFVTHESYEGSPNMRGLHLEISELVRQEAQAGLHSAGVFKKWSSQIDTLRLELRCLLKALHDAGKTIIGYGAPAKATTLMYHFGIDREIVKFIVDDNPLKQGLVTPGLRIPVVPVERMYDTAVDYVLILAWNFSESIILKHALFSENKGRFIVPLPNLQIC